MIKLDLAAQSMFEIPDFRDSSAHCLYLDLDASSYLKNNEYSNSFTRGFTGIGYMLGPGLKYYSSNNLSLHAGIFLQQYSGIDAYSKYVPTFTIDYKASDNLRIILGNIYGNLKHNIEEANYRFDRYYQDNLETGMQLLWHSDRFVADLWLDWQQFIFEGDDLQEQFQIGSVSELGILDSQFSLSWPMQVLFTHKGGEIDISPDPVSSILNLSTGLKLSYEGSQGSVEFKSLYFIFDALTVQDQGVNALPFEDGSALLFKLQYKRKSMTSSLSYWNSDSYYSPFGETLYHSISDHIIDYTEVDREILKYDFQWATQIASSAEISARLDLYYDLVNDDLAHAVGLYLVLDESFFLGKIK